MKNFEYLELAETNVSDYTIETMTKSKYISKLKYLSVSSCPISDYSIQKIAASTNFEKLVVLEIACTLITDSSAKSLCYSQCLKSLETVVTAECSGLTQEGIYLLGNSFYDSI